MTASSTARDRHGKARTKSDGNSPHVTGIIRCAVYTRKSSEEGLEQAFNSLDAQREACEAYILSQRHEGWTLVSTMYDDGGISGGTLARPALQRLLADITAKKIDTVVVYKVDRLTRSLSDFAKIVDVFDAQGASFVSITQQFNTTTSMGRLTLNMLLSFAQFEREVTGERIRDKIAASKRKGMWMGGNPPLGYDIQDRKLVINETEAEQVRHIFRRYIALGSVRLLVEDLKRDKIISKRRTSATGRTSGGTTLVRGALYLMLQNPIYRGQIVHKQACYPGEHAAIIDEDLWTAVAERLANNKQDRDTGALAESPSLLAGLLFDASGEPMTPTHAVKNGRRYRYYISRVLVTQSRAQAPHGQRIPAGDIETLVTDRLCTFLNSRHELQSSIAQHAADAASQLFMIAQAASLAQTWGQKTVAAQHQFLAALVPRINSGKLRIELHLNRFELLAHLQPEETRHPTDQQAADIIVLPIAAQLKRAGLGQRLIIENQHHATPDATLIRLLAKTFALRDQLFGGNGVTTRDVATAQSTTSSYATRLLRLTFLAPDIVRAILDGKQPATLTSRRLMADTRLPFAWAEQRDRLGFK
jgi:site-specific DNA recombinase